MDPRGYSPRHCRAGTGNDVLSYLRAGIDRADFTRPRGEWRYRTHPGGLLSHLSHDIGTEAGLRARGVLLDAIEASSAGSAVPVRFPTHPVARAIAEAIVSNPAHRVSLAKAVEDHGISPRTIRRIFLAETGKSFQQWSSTARLAESLELIRGGVSLDEVVGPLGLRCLELRLGVQKSLWDYAGAVSCRACGVLNLSANPAAVPRTPLPYSGAG